ncbi:hypothetical protein DFQ01_105115 [Paenibacillus cellulosilyticus]|uniref:Uncharacterized protein n=1 Tax=Paenibacillus cellulosilyticus TaxID=375489 RepID=A0A2V2YVY4_9BACL|nr:hypothetical protein [Paenibacillus cellulosilyticus]PWW05131.1 hypothetical protein DFQ01_105115 [Paenibacillus cellulosilyticus]QKS48678.1 hypothetical protein HUB94_31235 [Paenibacillus cellulosilyticus]
MTYQEKRSIVTLISTILIFAAYCLYMYPRYPEQGAELSELLHYWGAFVLVLMLISIIAHIVISIVFNIIYRMTTGEKEPGFTDELDRIIELRAHRTSFLLFILGFLCAMGSLVLEQPLYIMFDILIAAGFLADVSGSITKLYHYRRGI